jgi:hypothetical protein
MMSQRIPLGAFNWFERTGTAEGVLLRGNKQAERSSYNQSMVG